MAALVEGHNYGLSSFSSLNSHKSAFHVKLTDSALRAIEEFQRIKDVTSRRSKIQFTGNTGVIKVPIKKSSDNPEGYRTFHFGWSAIQGDPKGSFDCVQQKAYYGDGDELSLLGSMAHKVVVRASDDVFDDTKKKMTLAEEESKKQCAKEIKPGASGPYISKRVKKVVKREHLDLPLAPTSELSRSSLNSSSTPSPSSHSKSIVNKPPSSHSGGRSSPVLPSFSSKPPGSSGRSHSSPHYPVNKAPNSTVINLPFRERIIHLLALRPYKKPELLARLRKDGVKDRDKDSMSGILKSVAVFNPRDNSYTLSKHLYDGVRDDWPGYLEVDKQLLKRRRPQESASGNNSPVPSLSPAHSNCSQTASPTNSQKRPSSTSDHTEVVPSKKQRIAHERRDKKPAQSKIDIGRSEIKVRSPDLKTRSPEVKPSSPDYKIKSPKKSMSPEDKARSPDSTTAPHHNSSRNRNSNRDKSQKENHNNNIEEISRTEASSTSDCPDYLIKYKPILNREQRSHYKELFNTEYEEYRQLHATVDSTLKKFKHFESQIRAVKEGTEDYENMKNKILNEYKTIKKDQKFVDQRKRCDYLHRKLGHIKKLILEYDHSVMAQS